MTALSHLLKSFEELWPTATAEDWDRVGLMLGHPASEVSRVLLSVDVTAEVVDEAIESGAQLLLTHHPMLLRPVHELGELTAKGNLITKAVRGGLAIFAAHTNADVASGGVSQSLAAALGLTEISPLDAVTGHGCVGTVSSQKLVDFARNVAKVLPPVAQGVRVAGDPERIVSRVALVGGAGDGSQLVDGPALMDISHWAAESIWLESAAMQLSKLHSDVEFAVSEIRTDPWDFAVMQ
ncbi:MAG: Nif3-like dinuclear metal center hexameric protein [Actinobacteria bacterium]|nr:Nif3-like dinuclear metal center hexameric protein [Actinomycetota bacterium]